MITKEMTIEEILTLFPHKSEKLANEIERAGLHCVGCGAASWETLETGMLGHGMDLTAVERLTSRLNSVLQEQADPNTISITQKAAEKFRAFAAEEGRPNVAVRFGEEAAGCNGMQYVLDFSDQKTSDDAVFTHHGIEIHVHKDMLGRLIGSEIDYIEGMYGSGFKVSNPNVRHGCGCGKSHGY